MSRKNNAQLETSLLHVLTIEHRHGTEVTVHGTEADAEDAKAAFARYWWPEVAGRNGRPDSPPEDDAEAARLYFTDHPEGETAVVTPAIWESARNTTPAATFDAAAFRAWCAATDAAGRTNAAKHGLDGDYDSTGDSAATLAQDALYVLRDEPGVPGVFEYGPGVTGVTLWDTSDDDGPDFGCVVDVTVDGVDLNGGHLEARDLVQGERDEFGGLEMPMVDAAVLALDAVANAVNTAAAKLRGAPRRATQGDDTPNTRTILDLSTAHLPEEYGSTRLGRVPGVVAHEFKYGWLMWVPDDPQEKSDERNEAVPAEILRVQLYARQHDCDYVLFDQDGETNPDLPVWDW